MAARVRVLKHHLSAVHTFDRTIQAEFLGFRAGKGCPGSLAEFFTPDESTPGLSQAADRRVADVVAAGDLGQRLTGFAARDGFAALVRRQLPRSAEQHTMGLGTPAALAGAGPDQLALKFRDSTDDRYRISGRLA
jgi:hypothetical protein